MGTLWEQTRYYYVDEDKTSRSNRKEEKVWVLFALWRTYVLHRNRQRTKRREHDTITWDRLLSRRSIQWCLILTTASEVNRAKISKFFSTISHFKNSSFCCHSFFLICKFFSNSTSTNLYHPLHWVLEGKWFSSLKLFILLH